MLDQMRSCNKLGGKEEPSIETELRRQRCEALRMSHIIGGYDN